MRTSVKHHPTNWMLMTLGLIVSLVMTVMPVSRIMTTAHASQNSGAAKGQKEKGASTKPSTPGEGTGQIRALSSTDAVVQAPALSGGGGGDVINPEVEPNNTSATAQSLWSTPIRVRGDLYQNPIPVVGDEDWYSFTASAGDRVYAATMTSFSGGSTDTLIDLIASDGVTVLESDDDDGTFAGTSSTISGKLILVPGTYFLKVRAFIAAPPATLSNTVRPYDLYLRVQSGVPTPETEPNNNGQTPNPIPASGWMSGTIDPAADNDTFSFTANAGDTIYASLDPDPERDGVTWNPRLAIGIFNNNYLLVNDASTTSPNSEAHFMTVRTTGTYAIYVDSAVAATGGPTITYNLSVSVIPGNPPRKCTSYAGSTGAITDAGSTDFTVAIPDSKIISNLQLLMSETHGAQATADLDVSLISPDGNEVVLFDDPPTGAGAAAPQINFTIDDEAAIPAGSFGIHSGMNETPEPYARMAYFKGMQAQGTWTLRVRDDLSGNTGTLNSWSLNVCEDPALSFGTPGPLTTSIYGSNFESNDGAFTHSGTADEWARGLPSGASAPITTCHSGTNCWKTDLTGGYNINSNQDLLSPSINLAPHFGRAITASWWQKYQIESASFDSAWVEVREVGNPTNFRKLWEWKGATPTRLVGAGAGTTVQMSAGWGLMEYDISDFAGKNVELRFHLESDNTVVFSGLAIDDVAVTALAIPVRANFDASGPADLSVFRPSNGTWYINNSGGPVTQQQFGESTDKPVPADYDGDGDVDIAVFRPTEGAWYISKGSNQNFDRVVWGLNGDIPVPGDYDGDGKADVAVFRPADGFWYILRSSDSQLTALPWGLSTDKPVQADFDGDGKTDVAVFRPSNGTWYIIQSFTNTFRFVQWGTSSDTPVTGDYDGDRQFDVAIFRPSDGIWYLLLSSTKAPRALQWGVSGDIPTPSDFDGDRRYELVVFRPSNGTWYILRVSNGAFLGSSQWGQSGDVPAPRAGVVPD